MATHRPLTEGCPPEPGPAPVNRGFQKLFLQDHGFGAPIEILTFNSNEYAPHILQLFIHDEVDIAADSWGAPLITVTWGTGGVVQTAQLDVANGCSLVLVAERISVLAEFQAGDEVASLEADHWPSAVIGAMVQPCTGAQRNIATRTHPLEQIANMGTATFPIPRYARGVIIMSDDPSSYAATVDLQMWGGDDNGTQELFDIGLVASGAGAGSINVRNVGSGGMMIPPNAKSLTIMNGSGIARNYYPVFTLEF